MPNLRSTAATATIALAAGDEEVALTALNRLLSTLGVSGRTPGARAVVADLMPRVRAAGLTNLAQQLDDFLNIE